MNVTMKRSMLVLAASLLSISGTLFGADTHLTIKNNTKRTLHGVLWQGNDSVHTNHNGPEWQYGTISPKGSAKADVPSCKFSFVLWDDKWLWHYEIHDCTSTTLTVNGEGDSNFIQLK